MERIPCEERVLYGLSILKFVFSKVPVHLRPRKWSDRTSAGAIRIPTHRFIRGSQIPVVDPFSDWSKSYYAHKEKEGLAFRERRKRSDRWKRHKKSFETNRTGLPDIAPVGFQIDAITHLG